MNASGSPMTSSAHWPIEDETGGCPSAGIAGTEESNSKPNTNMTKQEAINKAAKLLRLATSSNPHEAALAASRAQEIIDKHNLDLGSINNEQAPEPDEPIIDFGHDHLEIPVHAKHPTVVWKIKLASGIARANQCRIYYRGGIGIAIVGRPSDVQTVRYFVAWLATEVVNLGKRDCAGRSSAYKNAYYTGAVVTIVQKVREQFAETLKAVRAEQAGNSLALVRIDHALVRLQRKDAEVADFLAKMSLGKGKAQRDPSNHGGFNAGREAAKAINIGTRKGVGRGVAGELN